MIRNHQSARSAWMASLLALAASTAWGGVDPKPADLVLVGGRIVTLDPKRPEAQALAAAGGRLVAVGTSDQIRPWIGPKTKVIELNGRFAMPGFIEGHGHLTSLGELKMGLDLTRARSWDDILKLVEERARTVKKGQWIVGQGWHQGKWDQVPMPNVEGYPLHDRLSAATPDHPVLLLHGTGHMCFANQAAMQRAGITSSTPDPRGGQILKDAKGEPTGAFRETAQSLIEGAHARDQKNRSADDVEADTIKSIALAEEECLSKGVTSFQDAGTSFSTIRLIRRLADEGRLALRLWIMVNDNNEALARHLADNRVIGHADNHLTVRAIKRMSDGALGSHGAWLLAPFDDLPSSTGLVVQPVSYIEATGRLALEHDYQLCVHAIGDRANREILDLFRSLLQGRPDGTAKRWRIEHAQHVHPADMPRFAELGIIASMQGNHCTSDGPFVVARLGEERAKHGAYAWRSLLDAGALVINGTDTPVEDVDPITSYHASVTRRMRDGKAFFPEQCMTRAEALRSYTSDAAFAAFEEDLKGTLTVGKLADVVVLSQDLLKVPDDKILDTKVDFTIVGGKVVHERK